MLTINNEKITKITDELKRELTKIYQHQLSKLILFGSQARGDANPDSDIDILVVLKEKVNPVEEINRNSYLISKICLEYDSLINCFYTSELELNNDNKLLIKNIKKDGILL